MQNRSRVSTVAPRHLALCSAEEMKYEIMKKNPGIYKKTPTTILLISLVALAANTFLPEIKPPSLFPYEDTDN